MRKSVPSIVALLALGVMAYFGIIGCSGENKKSEEKARKESPSHRVTATELGSAFMDNEVAATSKYKGLLIEVSGLISSIDSGLIDEPIVRLKTGEMFQDVLCYFNKGSIRDVSALRKGTPVTIRGVCDGEVMGSAVLEGCVLGR